MLPQKFLKFSSLESLKLHQIYKISNCIPAVQDNFFTRTTRLLMWITKKLHSSVPTLVDGTKLKCDAKEKSEVFNEYFCSQSKIDDGLASLPREIIYFQNDVSLSNARTTESEVLDLLKSVDIGKACRPDDIGNRILKLCADGISSSFSNLINLSLSEGKFPDAWKLANVTPIFKKDDRQSKVNYRPVSLLDSLFLLDSIRFYWK